MLATLPDRFLSKVNTNLKKTLSENTRFQFARGEVLRCLKEYAIAPKGPIVVGASGGKDSTLLLMLLASLDFQVTPLIVDLGYASFAADKIAHNLKALGFAPHIITVKEQTILEQFDPGDHDKIKSNLQILADPRNTTPCGSCSQVKRFALAHYCKELGSKWIAFGHHREDFISTILKDYFAYQYHQTGRCFSNEDFTDFISQSNIDEHSLRDLISNRHAATMAICLPLSDGVKLFRPMAFLAEAAIIELRDELHVKTFGSGCSHAIFTDNEQVFSTKRELVHANLVKRLQADPELGPRLLTIARESLDKNGLPICNPRETRTARLPGFGAK
jgi:tRNA(Ile)-lysidine synthase TilS/MesJ